MWTDGPEEFRSDHRRTGTRFLQTRCRGKGGDRVGSRPPGSHSDRRLLEGFEFQTTVESVTDLPGSRQTQVLVKRLWVRGFPSL